jgi:hypothetical protein
VSLGCPQPDRNLPLRVFDRATESDSLILGRRLSSTFRISGGKTQSLHESF